MDEVENEIICQQTTATLSPYDLTTCVGWLLDEARAFLQSDPQTRECEIHIIETAPPVRPQRVESIKEPKPRKKGNSKPRPAVHYGEWRVLRCRVLTSTEGAGALECLVAREQIIGPPL